MASHSQPDLPYCVIGAGPCGLTALKNLRQAGLPAVALEQEQDLGGNWNYGSPASSVYQSAHMISSKRLTEFTDLPMPKEYPPYPGHAQVLAYLRDYAERFALAEHIRFGCAVERLEPAEVGWRVHFADGRDSEQFAGVLVANGHHWDPRWPEYPGEFSGQIMHARQYRTPEVLAGRRVVVVGAGNTGCDIAVEAAQHAAAVFHSLRRGYHFLPKFLFGRPADACGVYLQRWRAPLWLRRRAAARAMRVAIGEPQTYGLPAPDHRLFETHPIVNSQLLYFVGHGRIGIKPDVARLEGDSVEFADGSREKIDLILYATGYKLSFPFLDRGYLNWDGAAPRLFLNAFHPQRDDLFVIGMIQPNGAIFPLAELQAKLAAQFLVAARTGDRRADWFRRLKAKDRGGASGGIKYDASPRHAIEVDYFDYRRRLEKLVRKMG